MDENDFLISLGLAFILWVIIFCLLPVTDSVNAKNWDKSVAACASNEGLVRVYRPSYFSQKFEALCGNKVTVTMQAEEE